MSTGWAIGERARAVHEGSLIWDAHACLPLLPGQSMTALERHRAAGAGFVSINVGMDMNPVSQVMRVIAAFRAWLAEHSDRFVLAGTVAEIAAARRAGKLAVAFDLEGSTMLEDDLAMLRLYRDLGVRQIHLAYNRDNSIAVGCHGSDVGLSALGRRVVAEVNALGLIMDCSHSGLQTSLEVMALSQKPVVFSHSNPKGLKGHARNITDEQIRACAATGGVVAVSGIGIFLGANDIRTETLLRHIDYVVERVGVDHVGLGLDYVFDREADDLPPDVDRKEWWPPGNEYGEGMEIVPPERLPEITEGLLARNYSAEDVAKILGGNMARAAKASWGA